MKKKTIKKLLRQQQKKVKELSQSKRELLIPLIPSVFFITVCFLMAVGIPIDVTGVWALLWIYLVYLLSIFIFPFLYLTAMLEPVFPSPIAWGITFLVYYFFWYTVINKKILWLMVIVTTLGVLAFHPYLAPEKTPENLSAVEKEVAEMAKKEIKAEVDPIPKLRINVLNISHEPPCQWRVNTEIISYFGIKTPMTLGFYKCPS